MITGTGRSRVSRFPMTVHCESKELPIYALVAAKNGPKIGPWAWRPMASCAVRAPEGKDRFPGPAGRWST
jgi:uncharacterized protein (TIGR03435 family)